MQIFELVSKIALEGMDAAQKRMSALEDYVKKNEKSFKAMGVAITSVGALGLAMATSSHQPNSEPPDLPRCCD